MSNQWREALPAYRSDALTLREVEHADAASLAQHLSSEEVRHFISPPPRTLEALEQWIARARTRRAEGARACFAIVPANRSTAVGFIQLWRLKRGDDSSVWAMGFVLGREFWGTGLFHEAARAALTIAFDRLQAARVEATCLVENGRGNRALEKLGAVHTGIALQMSDPDGNVGDFKKWEFRKERFARNRPPDQDTSTSTLPRP
jgi:ribosomal-protein-alanine N-acetyltransferase